MKPSHFCYFRIGPTSTDANRSSSLRCLPLIISLLPYKYHALILKMKPNYFLATGAISALEQVFKLTDSLRGLCLKCQQLSIVQTALCIYTHILIALHFRHTHYTYIEELFIQRLPIL